LIINAVKQKQKTMNKFSANKLAMKLVKAFSFQKMIKSHFIVLTLAMVLLFFVNESNAQISVTTVGTAYTENFDAMGASATAALPTGFKVGSDWATGRTVTTRSAGTSGTGALTSTSGGGDYNFANGVLATATDRALGFLNASSFTTPDTIFLKITNNTGGSLSLIHI
jgi:hypothetical protein